MATKKRLLIFIFLLVGVFFFFPRQNNIKAATGACPLSFSCTGGACIAVCANPPTGYFSDVSCDALVGTHVVDNDSPSTNIQIDFWMEKGLAGNEDLPYNIYLGAAWTTNHVFTFNPQNIQTTINDGSKTYNPKTYFFAGKQRSISAYAINVNSSGARQDYDSQGNHLDTRLGVKTINCTSVFPTPIYYGLNLITNGDFSQGETAWNLNYANPPSSGKYSHRVENGVLTIYNGGPAVQKITLIPNNTYRLVASVGVNGVSYSGVADVCMVEVNASNVAGYKNPNLCLKFSENYPTAKELKFIAPTDFYSTAVQLFHHGGANVDVMFDNIGLYEVSSSKPTIPSVPTNTSATCPQPGTTAKLSWDRVSGATFYSVYAQSADHSFDWAKACSGSNFCQTVSTPSTSTSFTTSPDVKYVWYVTAGNSTGESAVTGSSFTCSSTTSTQVDCATIGRTWSVSNIIPTYVDGKVGLTINGSFPNINECGRNDWSLVYSYKGSYGVEEKSYYRSSSDQVETFNTSQIKLKPLFSFTDGTHTAWVNYCSSPQSNGVCTAPFSDVRKTFVITNPSSTCVPPPPCLCSTSGGVRCMLPWREDYCACPTPLPNSCSLRPQGDANCDGLVDKADLGIFIGSVGGQDSSDTTYSADFNTDKKVNLLDYEIWRNTVFK